MKSAGGATDASVSERVLVAGQNRYACGTLWRSPVPMVIVGADPNRKARAFSKMSVPAIDANAS
jgi:hypothetical protein